jgi:hypothetical protein
MKKNGKGADVVAPLCPKLVASKDYLN